MQKDTTSSHNSTKPVVVRSAYYTPSIDEFHVGFEYEARLDDDYKPNKLKKDYRLSPLLCLAWFPIEIGTWHKLKIENLDFSVSMLNAENLGKCKNIRVKHLDDDDLVSMGGNLKIIPCPFKGKTNTYLFNRVADSDSKILIFDGYSTTYQVQQEPNQWVRIFRIDVGGFSGGEHTQQVFWGMLRNKSELNRTLQQLGCVQS